MKKLTYIVLTLCLALYSCGMTDVWKDWEDEGTLSTDRLKPSEVKEILCAAEGWKMTYKGIDFYFQFNDGGYVISDTDESILENKVEDGYHLDFKGADKVFLTLENAGALKYLTEGSEETLVITAYTNQKITAKGEVNGVAMDLTPVTSVEIKKNDDAKKAAIVARNKALFLSKVQTELYNGVIRDANGKFIAHYAISGANNESIKISVLENRVLTHYERTLTIGADDENGTFNFDAVTLNGSSVKQILYRFDNSAMSTDTKLSVAPNKDARGFFTGSSYKTYVISKNNSKGDAKEELWQELSWKSVGDIELSDRDVRPLVLCPGSEDAVWYTFFDANWTVKTEFDRIYFTKSKGYMPYGGADRIAEVEQKLTKFFAGWFHADGLYVVQETNGGVAYLYFVSPTTSNWFKLQK